MAKKIVQAKPVGNATGLRIGAFILWALGLACEVVGILFLLQKIMIPEAYLLWALIGALVLDMIFVIIGSQLWKRANHIDPASEKNKLAFWCQNNLGVIISVIAFAPIIILILLNKDADKKTKAIATVVAVAALAITGLSSYDWNPVSQEDLARATGYFQGREVYYTPGGKVYHATEDCGYLKNSTTIEKGGVESAFEHNKTRLCKSCAKKLGVTSETLPVQE
ncbi:MAG: hypothetical protein IJU92_03535 [Spirochaetaceae bacterium]|nr:hypothetical protein [Spirochaetaceae bacterium]